MKPSLLLHCCCAPCSSAIIEHLSNYFDITLFFYNPCITNIEEYEKRLGELAEFIKKFNMFEYKDVKVVYGRYNNKEFYEIAKGLENEPERGKRCLKCYTQRLVETAEYAKANGFTLFSTTLSISPYKDQKMLNKIGMAVAGEYGLKYFCSDFSYLYPRSLELCEEYGLYQQDYCGCEYSKKYSSEIPK